MATPPVFSLLRVVFLLFVFGSAVSLASMACMNELNRQVDWWVVIKFPYLANSSNQSLITGYAYAYADSDVPTLQISNNQLNEGAGGSVGFTLSQVADASSSTGWLLYNDESTDGKNHETFAHMKGVVGFDHTSGFWLVHSVPRYPDLTTSVLYPTEEKEYGQSYLCITMETTMVNTIGAQLLIDRPFVYSSNFPSTFSSALPNINSVVQGNWSTDKNTSIVEFKSSAGATFYSFAKTSKWNNELYEYLVQPHFKKDGYWETWLNGQGSLNSYCTPTYAYDSMNVDSININNQVNWVSSKDHSKWGALLDSTYLCIGDINRQTGQEVRGGGTVCFSNKDMYNSMYNSISTVESC